VVVVKSKKEGRVALSRTKVESRLRKEEEEEEKKMPIIIHETAAE
jgi:hypothetical protein